LPGSVESKALSRKFDLRPFREAPASVDPDRDLCVVAMGATLPRLITA
jgi:hypothetical protein